MICQLCKVKLNIINLTSWYLFFCWKTSSNLGTCFSTTWYFYLTWKAFKHFSLWSNIMSRSSTNFVKEDTFGYSSLFIFWEITTFYLLHLIDLLFIYYLQLEYCLDLFFNCKNIPTKFLQLWQWEFALTFLYGLLINENNG